MSDWYEPASAAHIKKEKAKARELRQSQWWRQTVGTGVCYYCEQKFPIDQLTMDHVIPIARGGVSSKKNCVPACKECNTSKGSKTVAELTLEILSKESS